MFRQIKAIFHLRGVWLSDQQFTALKNVKNFDSNEWVYEIHHKILFLLGEQGSRGHQGMFLHQSYLSKYPTLFYIDIQNTAS